MSNSLSLETTVYSVASYRRELCGIAADVAVVTVAVAAAGDSVADDGMSPASFYCWWTRRANILVYAYKSNRVSFIRFGFFFGRLMFR